MGLDQASPSAPRLSLEEWLKLPEGTPGELSGGFLVEEEMPDYVHELLTALIVRLLGNWIIPLGGLVGGSDSKLVLGPEHGRKPDVTVYFADSPWPPRRGVIRVPPDIAVEVVSPTPRDGRRDRVDKMKEYASFGVRWYWIVDPEIRSVEIYELGSDGRYTRALGETEGHIGEVPGCLGLSLDIDELWAMADRLRNAEDS